MKRSNLQLLQLGFWNMFIFWVRGVLDLCCIFFFRLKMYAQTTFDETKVFMKVEGEQANSLRYSISINRLVLHAALNYQV